LRESANTAAWPLQLELESIVSEQLRQAGWDVVRAFEPTDHGFVRSQRMGLEVFKQIPRDAPLVVAIANWQYSHHVLAGLRTHRGPILTVANFEGDWPGLVGLLAPNAGPTKMGRAYASASSGDCAHVWFRDRVLEWIWTRTHRGPIPTVANFEGDWPGLVGLLGLNAGLTKMGRAYATTWSVDCADDWFRDGIREWIETGSITHDTSHVRPLPALPESPERE